MEIVKSLKKELVYKGVTVDFYKDYVQMPDGKVAEWDFVDHKGAAAILPVTKDGKIIMVQQYRNALNRITLEIPAGKIDPGETPYEAAVRELTEETGYKSDKITHLKDIVTAIGFCNEIVYTYLAENLESARQNLDEDEYIDVCEYSLDEVIEMILTNQLIDAKTVAAVLTYYTKVHTGL